MTGLKRWHLITAFLALMLLRMVIGYHFFHEGTTKLRAGNFESEPFLKQAKGPFAGFYRQMLDDPDGHWRLCIRSVDQFGKPIEPVIDTSYVFAIWDDFVLKASEYYRFDDSMMKDVLEKQKSSANSEELSGDQTSKIETLSNQSMTAELILNHHKKQLADFIDANRMDILAYAKSAKRLEGFARDGDSRNAVANQVTSLQQQVESIAKQRPANNRAWFSSVEAIWDSLESGINNLAIAEQRKNNKPLLEMHRPYQLKNSMVEIVNQAIPWFDTIVGGLLLIGMFTRFASVAAIAFLLSVVFSQPFWVVGTQETWMQWIEIFALIVIFATCAGRYGGFDFFLHRFFGKPELTGEIQETIVS